VKMTCTNAARLYGFKIEAKKETARVEAPHAVT